MYDKASLLYSIGKVFCIRSSEKNSKKEFYDLQVLRSLVIHSVFDIVLICFFDELQHF